MHILSNEERVQRHLDYWEDRQQVRPLSLIRLGEGIFSREYEACRKLLVPTGYTGPARYIDPAEIRVDDYLPDVERMYRELQSVDCDSFFAAEPMTGFPWIEAAMGAKVKATNVSFVTESAFNDVEDIENIRVDEENPWFKLYLEFCEKLNALSAGRFPVGEPILRGCSDTVAALVGSKNMVLATYRKKKLTEKIFANIVETQRRLIQRQHEIVDPFMGGYSMAFYYLWAPGKVMWYQEDQVALLGPRTYKNLLFDIDQEYLKGYDYTLVHLHPNAFFEIDELLKIDALKVIELNKDHGGPTIRDMGPICTKIIEAGKKVVVGMGPVDTDDIDALYDCYPDHGVAVNIVAKDAKEANELAEYMNRRARR